MSHFGSDVFHTAGRSRYKSSGYNAAHIARNSGVPLPRGGSGDRHLTWDHKLLAAIAEAFDRNNAVYESIENRLIDVILGSGFTLDPKTGDDDLNVRIKADWAEFGKDPEVRGIFDWREVERMSLRSVMNGGDMGAVLVRDLQKFQFVEWERIKGGRRAVAASRDGGRILNGVEMDRLGRPIAYWVSPRNEAGMVQAGRARRIKTEDFVFVANRKRYSQTRGVPVLTTAFNVVHRINDVLDSEAISWQLLSRFAVAINREAGAEKALQESSEDPHGRDLNDPKHVPDRIQDYGDAIIFHGSAGEKVEGIKRDLPGKNFKDSTNMFLRLSALPVGLPLEVLLLDFSDLNYTGSRAMLEQLFRSVLVWQSWLKRNHHSPLFTAWLTWRIADKFYPDLPTTFLHSFLSPEFPWVDQLKESQAWQNRMDAGLATQTQALKSINMDRDVWLEERGKEIASAIEKANELNTQFPGAMVPWEIFAGVRISRQRAVQTVEEDGSSARSSTSDPLRRLNGNGKGPSGPPRERYTEQDLLRAAGIQLVMPPPIVEVDVPVTIHTPAVENRVEVPVHVEAAKVEVPILQEIHSPPVQVDNHLPAPNVEVSVSPELALPTGAIPAPEVTVQVDTAPIAKAVDALQDVVKEQGEADKRIEISFLRKGQTPVGGIERAVGTVEETE